MIAADGLVEEVLGGFWEIFPMGHQGFQSV